MDINKEHTDKFLKQAMAIKEVPLESPGQNFIPSLMDKIEALETQTQNATSSIIPGWGWALIGIITISMFGAILLSGPVSFDYSCLSIFRFKLSPLLPKLSVSPTFVTATLVFVFFFIVEVVIISGRNRGSGVLRS